MTTQRASRSRQAPFNESVQALIERYGVSYQLHGVQFLRVPIEALIPSQVLPFEIHVSAETPRNLPPRFIETKITNDAEWKQREIPILMELSRLFGHPSTTASESLRQRLWEFDDHNIVYSTYPTEGRHTLRIELSEAAFQQLKEKAASRAARVDSIELGAPGVLFEYQSFHRWLEETLQPSLQDSAQVRATKSASTLQLSTPGGVLNVSAEAQVSLILRDFGDREQIQGYSLFITLKNPVGNFPPFVEASFCTCAIENMQAIEGVAEKLAQFWEVPFRREISVARY